jgi:hypothetical protein
MLLKEDIQRCPLPPAATRKRFANAAGSYPARRQGLSPLPFHDPFIPDETGKRAASLLPGRTASMRSTVRSALACKEQLPTRSKLPCLQLPSGRSGSLWHMIISASLALKYPWLACPAAPERCGQASSDAARARRRALWVHSIEKRPGGSAIARHGAPLPSHVFRAGGRLAPPMVQTSAGQGAPLCLMFAPRFRYLLVYRTAWA